MDAVGYMDTIALKHKLVFVCFLLSGSKNPQISLKLVEIQTDPQGKVSV